MNREECGKKILLFRKILEKFKIKKSELTKKENKLITRLIKEEIERENNCLKAINYEGVKDLQYRRVF